MAVLKSDTTIGGRNVLEELDGKAASGHKHSTNDLNAGALPITRGGTGATTASAALAALGALPISGGIITGNLTLKGSGNYGNKINFGDGDYVHLYEVSDDKLEIKASNINFVVSGSMQKNGVAFDPAGSNFTTGVYTGTGDGETQTIYLGFKPSVLLISPKGGLTLDNWRYLHSLSVPGYPGQFVTLTNTGFTVTSTLNFAPNESSTYYKERNPYRYVAWR